MVAYSSGNHAQGVAAAAALLGVPAAIVMPEDAPAIKIANTRGYGAEVVLYDRQTENREALGAALAAERGATIVRPYDDPGVIAGQGTCGLEIARQAAALGLEIDALLVCCGGGGLTAGCALAMAELSPRTQLYTVEPAAFDDTRRSLAGGARVVNDPAARSFCDALLAPTPGELTFPINHRLLAGGLRGQRRRNPRGHEICFSDLETGDRAGRRGRFGGLAGRPSWKHAARPWP